MTGNLQLDQILFLLIIMILTAFPAGFAAGLFGIGGGLITVPILFYIFSNSGIESSYLMHLAVGTSFAIIIPTSTVSVMTHHQHKAVDFSLVKGYGIFVITGVVLGTIFAANLKTKPLILFFSVVVYMLAFYLLFLKEKEKDIKINIPEVDITDKDIDVVISNIQKQNTVWTDSLDKSKSGNKIVVDYLGKIDGEEFKNNKQFPCFVNPFRLLLKFTESYSSDRQEFLPTVKLFRL